MITRYGSWALVTGASSGIGKALAHQLAAQGMNLVVVARTASRLQALADELTALHGHEVRPVAADLSSRQGIEALIAAVDDLEIDVLIPCAAMETSGYFVDTDIGVHTALLDMDCYGPMRLAHHFGRGMTDRKRGAILFVSSMSGWAGQPYMAHYGAAKAYVLSLGEALHHELKDHGVDVAVLSPGPTDTPMAAGTGIDFASMGMAIMRPDDVAATGLAALGRTQVAVPGVRNKLMAMMMTRLMPRAWVGAMFRMMMGRALSIARPA